MGARTSPPPTAHSPAPPDTALARRNLMLVLALLGGVVNFWAWALLSPLGPLFKDLLGLTSFQ
ncbi:Nitrate/nitrite transporter NarK [Actinosynnema pretiosum subsp. pretiosum]|nr:Nitrate/nitrite transporter NarK [Actinosynnema pretiosum subsp. pretiosum]